MNEHFVSYTTLRSVGLGKIGDLRSAGTVDSVLGTRVIRIELLAHLEHFISKGVEIHHLAREPWSRVEEVYTIKMERVDQCHGTLLQVFFLTR